MSTLDVYLLLLQLLLVGLCFALLPLTSRAAGGKHRGSTSRGREGARSKERKREGVSSGRGGRGRALSSSSSVGSQ